MQDKLELRACCACSRCRMCQHILSSAFRHHTCTLLPPTQQNHQHQQPPSPPPFITRQNETFGLQHQYQALLTSDTARVQLCHLWIRPTSLKLRCPDAYMSFMRSAPHPCTVDKKMHHHTVICTASAATRWQHCYSSHVQCLAGHT